MIVSVTNYYLGALNGMGRPSKSMFLMILYYIVVRMPLAYLLFHLGFDLNGIWTANGRQAPQKSF